MTNRTVDFDVTVAIVSSLCLLFAATGVLRAIVAYSTQ
jgi:hypothetical protein